MQYVGNKDLLQEVWNVRSICDKLYYDDILLLKAILNDRHHGKSTRKKKKSNKSLVQDITYRNIEL